MNTEKSYDEEVREREAFDVELETRLGPGHFFGLRDWRKVFGENDLALVQDFPVSLAVLERIVKQEGGADKVFLFYLPEIVSPQVEFCLQRLFILLGGDSEAWKKDVQAGYVHAAKDVGLAKSIHCGWSLIRLKPSKTGVVKLHEKVDPLVIACVLTMFKLKNDTELVSEKYLLSAEMVTRYDANPGTQWEGQDDWNVHSAVGVGVISGELSIRFDRYGRPLPQAVAKPLDSLGYLLRRQMRLK